MHVTWQRPICFLSGAQVIAKKLILILSSCRSMSGTWNAGGSSLQALKRGSKTKKKQLKILITDCIIEICSEPVLDSNFWLKL